MDCCKEETVEAVPSSWIVDDVCVWPPFHGRPLQNAIQRQEAPADNWDSYNISHFESSSYANYTVARLKASKAEVTSDLNSDATDTGKRKVARKLYSSDESDEDDTAVSFLPTPPSLKRKDKVARTEQEGEESRDVQHPVVSVQEVPTASTSFSGNVVVNNPPPTPKSDQKDCTCCPVHGKDANAHYKQFIRKHNIVIAMFSQVLEELTLLKERDGATSSAAVIKQSIFTSFNFPVDTQDDLLKLETFLKDKDNFEKATEELSRMGGSNPYDFIKRILSKLISNQLAAEYSWYGLKKKQIFGKLLLSQLILAAGARLNKATIKELEDAIRSWLRRAKERAQTDSKSKSK